ncbi:MAG: efflux RND transporter periplasmic adaptor subunit [Opitutae bacterium]|nr:efflux RND transporter periplasmic adaptor subunit [Opitutae bacterium]
MISPVCLSFCRSFVRTGLGAALLLGLLAGCGEKPAAGGRGRGGGGPAPVLTGQAQRKVAPLVLDAIGAVEPIRTATLRSLVTGVLWKVDFREGQEVQQGDLLFEIDPRTFQNAVRSAEADLQKIRTQLANAQEQLARYQKLSTDAMVSQEQFQTIQTTERTLRATLRVSEATLENAKLQLEFCSIRAPIAGRTGNLGAREGDLVRASDATVSLVTIHQLSPIYVTFAVPQQHLAALQRQRAAGSVRVTAAPAHATEAPEIGELSFIDNAIDAATGTLKLKATFANADRGLWPGQFVNVRVHLSAPEALVVPAQAVQNDQHGQHVFVVKEDQTAELRPVVIERQAEGFAVVTKGVREGETVITDGHLRVVPGGRVEVKTPGEAGGAPKGPPGAGKGKGKGEGKGKAKAP